MHIASISLPVEQEDGSTKLVRKPVKLGRFTTDTEAFAFAQRTFNRWGGKVHSVAKVGGDDLKVSSELTAEGKANA